MIILGGLLFAGGVSAAAVVTPAPKAATTPKLSLTPEQSKLVCLKGNLVLAVLNRGGYESQAYSFCSSYIKIPPVTSSVTTTQTSFVVTTTTEPATSTKVVTLGEVTVTRTQTVTSRNPQDPVKRDAAPATAAATLFAAWKSALAAFVPEIVSAGCSCIQTKIPLATTTTTLAATTTKTSATITETSTLVILTTTQATTTTTTTTVQPGCPLANIRRATLPLSASVDGTCGGNTGFTCIRSPFGACCGANGFCGIIPSSCGAGCQPQFGLCAVVPSSPVC